MLPQFNGRAFLAPMAGVSDPALRLLCKELGAALVVTEFTSIHAIVAKEQDISKFIEYSPKERPLSVQLFGSDLVKLKKAIKIVEPHFDCIDYNMGCPAPHITSQMACSALLQHPQMTRKILETMVQSTSLPITLKIRSGVTKPDAWGPIAKIAQDVGVQMITLHPRTVKQGYSGKADWSLIAALKKMVTIPVVGNGDITCPEDAKRMMDETGCDYVMVGRAAMKNPFIFQQINEYLATGTYAKVNYAQRVNAFFRYLGYSKAYSTIKFANIKMQAMQFTKGEGGGKRIREQLMGVKTVEELVDILKVR